MPIADTDLKKYQSANMPEDDAGTSGGAINTNGILEVTQLAANDALEALSSNAADTMNLTIHGRSAAGAIVNEVKALNGTNVVSFTVLGTIERFLKALLAAGPAGAVTIRRAGGGATVCVIPAGKTSARILNYDSKSEAAQTVRYEKEFWKNEHGTLTLNGATMKLTADPSAKYKIGCATTKNDSGSVANRKTAPGGITFVDDNIDAGIPGGNLAAGDAIGVWIEQTLAAGAAPAKTSYTTELAGTTT